MWKFFPTSTARRNTHTCYPLTMPGPSTGPTGSQADLAPLRPLGQIKMLYGLFKDWFAVQRGTATWKRMGGCEPGIHIGSGASPYLSVCQQVIAMGLEHSSVRWQSSLLAFCFFVWLVVCGELFFFFLRLYVFLVLLQN